MSQIWEEGHITGEWEVREAFGPDLGGSSHKRKREDRQGKRKAVSSGQRQESLGQRGICHMVSFNMDSNEQNKPNNK